MFNETVAQDGLLISAEVLDAANIRQGDVVSITVAAGSVTVNTLPAENEGAAFRASMDKVFEKHEKLFQALAEGAP